MEHERIVFVLDYLERYTDDSKWASIRDIINYLEVEHGYEKLSTLTIRRDIERLTAMGKNVQVKKGAHNIHLYSLKSGNFTFNEIRFLVDSVSINKFLTYSQKQRLFRKFEGMCSEAEVRRLVSRIHLSDVARKNTDLLDNLEKIHIIIGEKRLIHFEYGKFDVHKQVNYYSKRRSLVPCKVIYFNERFYLKCINEEDAKVRTYRVDRMKDIKPGETFEGSRSLPDTPGVVLDMFEPDYYENVTFRVKRFLLDDMMEQFGNRASYHDIIGDDEHITINVLIGINQSFYRWVLRYGENIQIISPNNVREAFLNNLETIVKLYGWHSSYINSEQLE